MSKALRTVGVVAGVVALTIATAGAFAPAGATILGASFATAAAVASAVSAVAMAGSQALQKPPDMKGTINEVLIGANMPVPYVMGRTFVGGMKVYDDSSDGADNDERTHIFVGSVAGPIEAFEAFLADYSEIVFDDSDAARIEGRAIGFYHNFLWVNSRLGSRPDAELWATTGTTGDFRGWTSDHKLSGMPCWSATMEFDEEGVRFASGIPAFGMVGKWVWAYDPRLDDTYPGGSGAQRWDDELSWAWSDNPGLHAMTYARGRFVGPNAVRVVGAGIPELSIDKAAFVELANVCEANGWALGGAVYEGPGFSKWDNLKRILDAAVARPVWVGGMLTVSISAPKVALDTVTMADLTEGEVVIPAMAAWKGKFNTIVPRYRSEAHRWEYVQAEAVTSSTYLAEDGEPKTDERQYDLIQDVDHAAQRAAYDLANEREFGPIQLPVKPRLRLYRPGEALEIDLPELGLSGQLAVITGRTIDPATSAVMLELSSETDAKHAFALGQSGVAPPTPSLVPSEDVDQYIGALSETEVQTALRNTYARGLTATGVDAGATASIDLSTFTFDYPGTTGDVAAPSGSVTSLAFSTVYYLFADVDSIGDLSPAYGATTNFAESLNSSAHPMRISLATKVTTPADGAASTGGSGSGGGYGGGGDDGGGIPDLP